MPRDGNVTREKILDTAMGLAISQGHVATPIDEVIAAVGITKGTFFYHFPSKKHLAIAMIDKFSNKKIAILNRFMAQAEAENEDVLQQLMQFVSLVQDQHAQLNREEIGCLYASYCYENQLVDEQVQTTVAETMAAWQDKLSQKLQQVVADYPPVLTIDIDKVAGMFLTALEGAYIMARITPEHNAVEVYLEQYKQYLQALFNPGAAQA